MAHSPQDFNLDDLRHLLLSRQGSANPHLRR